MNTWLLAIAGGALIGAASGGLMLGLGRIAGISGVFGGLVTPPPGEWRWRLAFVAGMVLAGGVATLAGFWTPVDYGGSLAMLSAAGLLVGAGTSLANGCTSGHGVCGMALLSTRSLVAVATFLTTGFIVTYILRHMMGGA
jgi:uncharacterized protein